MNRVAGFSTAFLNKEEWSGMLQRLKVRRASAVEFRVRNEGELNDFPELLDSVDFSSLGYVSLLLDFDTREIVNIDRARQVVAYLPTSWPIVVSADLLDEDFGRYVLANQLCIRNMGKRGKHGRSVSELQPMFQRFPQASLALDIGQARQVDPTMVEASLLLRHFRERLRLIYLSEVMESGRHEGISRTAFHSFRQIAALIPRDVPVIMPIECSEVDLSIAIQVLTRVECGKATAVSTDLPAETVIARR